ncbi:GNAT family N-acetyltransferase [Pelomonas sp. CA6]|uniref:GNAT family N-acetyltransferase n=1 Tax=Pelomonas sp. CA6 TaxID=2907999 RepID=UPI001F4AB154|nr:GNAT family N-acetyltransferase [Pelomonas sp. CA6]MCH7342822.1 GNAT family N-acetyltransferase [Pelomonas sp. CA6]
MTPESLAELGRRAELAGLNASASPHEAHLEGWLLRLSPGKARRSRCVNALAQGRLPLDEMLARCRRSFDAAGLPLILRITPYSQPVDLDEQLEARGWTRFELSHVMVRESLNALDDELPTGLRLCPVDSDRYARLIGELRGSAEAEILGQQQRLRAAPVRYQAFMLQRNNSDGTAELLACGQFTLEEGLVGLYDIFTPPAHRGQGHGRALCAALLREARRQGARQAYLQVSGGNTLAQRLYTGLGFELAYRYHYRSDDPRALG